MTILDSPDSDRRHGGFERHVQSVLTLSVVALLTWQLSTIESMRVEVAILSGRVDALAARVDEASSDRYRTVDATRDFALRDQVIEGLNYRIKRVEAICATQKETGN